MRRILIHVALVFCVVWQTAAFAYFGAPGVARSDSNHERMHLETQSHHHDADGSLAFDDSVASLLHMTADLAGSASMVREMALRLLCTADVAPRATLDDTRPPPYLEGPLRPPRPTV